MPLLALSTVNTPSRFSAQRVEATSSRRRGDQRRRRWPKHRQVGLKFAMTVDGRLGVARSMAVTPRGMLERVRTTIAGTSYDMPHHY